MGIEFAVLRDRTIIEVSGPEAGALLQRLVTNDVEALAPGEARYAALLTPQGKIVTDFFVVALDDAGTFLIDAPAALAGEFVKKLTLDRLRAKVAITDRSADLGVVAFVPGATPTPVLQAFVDPRGPGLWDRAIVPIAGLADPGGDAGRRAYADQRIRAGIPEGGIDFAYGDAFPHEANLDRLHGVDFRKGCYVGQEVVSRVEHRKTARKRIVSLAFEGEAPPVGTEILADDIPVGTMGSSAGGVGLGLIRLDRVEEARLTPGRVTAGGVPLRLVDASGVASA